MLIFITPNGSFRERRDFPGIPAREAKNMLATAGLPAHAARLMLNRPPAFPIIVDCAGAFYDEAPWVNDYGLDDMGEVSNAHSNAQEAFDEACDAQGVR